MIIAEILKDLKWAVLNKSREKWLRASEAEIRAELAGWYAKRTGKTLNLDDPKTFNEKIQWLKLYDTTPLKARLADKYAVRSWIAEQIGEEYLFPLIGAWDSVDEIDFSGLPSQFVLKTNNGASCNIIVTDKSKLNIPDAKRQLKRWLRTNYALKMGFELQYGMIPPKIVCEKLMGDNLADYKLFCFNGEPEFFWVDTDRYSSHKRSTFDLNWQPLPFRIKKYDRDNVPPPKNLGAMIEIGRKLAAGFPHVRVDFYEIDGKLYFGEMTFTSASGQGAFTPEEYDRIYGDKIILPEKKPIPMEEIRKIWERR